MCQRSLFHIGGIQSNTNVEARGIMGSIDGFERRASNPIWIRRYGASPRSSNVYRSFLHPALTQTCNVGIETLAMFAAYKSPAACVGGVLLDGGCVLPTLQ